MAEENNFFFGGGTQNLLFKLIDEVYWMTELGEEFEETVQKIREIIRIVFTIAAFFK